MQLHPFRPRLLDALKGYERRHFFSDLGAGIARWPLGLDHIAPHLGAALARAPATRPPLNA